MGKRHRLSFSLRIPGGFLHFRGLTYDGCSRYHVIGSYEGIVDPQRITNPKMHKNLTHHDRRGRVISKTIRSFFGEPNHYESHGRCVGYSRKQSAFRTNHYDRRGNLVGYSSHCFGILLIHYMMD